MKKNNLSHGGTTTEVRFEQSDVDYIEGRRIEYLKVVSAEMWENFDFEEIRMEERKKVMVEIDSVL
eukprot:Awhi_evm1s6268